ncbi:MAG: L-lactate permease [Candidatus Paceibacterota bacterium]
MNNMPILLAVFPFIVFLFLLLVKKTPLLLTSIITLALYTILAIFYWQIFPSFLYASYGKGFFVAFDIFIIIFGAIFFLEILKDLKIINNISYYLGSLSKDYRIQIILIAWFLECFIEGTAGFGTPAAIAVPILIGLGLTPIKALVVGLLGNSTPGVFGAAGTPIKMGFVGLNTTLVPLYAALLNCVGFIVPIFMLWIITQGRPNRKKEFFDALPFAIFSGLIFVVPSLVFLLLGQEFPSILGSLFGMIVIIFSIKMKFLVPKENLDLSTIKGEKSSMSSIKAFLPYIILISLLILGKIFLSKMGITLSLGFKHIFNLFNPGFIFIASGLLVILIWQEKERVFLSSVKKAFKGAIHPFIVVFSMLAMVQIMINSGNNYSGLLSAITLMTEGFETSLLPFFTPFIGAFGAFMTGSVTVSNIMFGHLFSNAATNLFMNPSIILSLGVVGAAAGNMIALADILTAEAVTGMKNSEVKVLKGVIVPCLIYLSIIGIIGIIVLG